MNKVYVYSELIIVELELFELGLRNPFTQTYRFKKLLISYAFLTERSLMYKHKHGECPIISRCSRYI